MIEKIETTLTRFLHWGKSIVMEKAMKNMIQLAFAFAYIMVLSACSQKDTIVWVASPWQRVMRNTPPNEMNEVKLKAAANEYEPFRIIIHAGTLPLKNVNVIVSSLKNTNGEIPSSNLQLYRANYLNITKPSYRTKNPVGWYPDALIPFTEPQSGNKSGNVTCVAAPFNIDTAQNAEVWCDLHVPSGTKSGIYIGRATVIAEKRKLATIPIELKVWDFEIPDKISMYSHFGGLNNEAAKMMGVEVGSEEFNAIEALYDKELLKHRAVPSAPGSIWPEWNEKDGIIDHGEANRLKQLIEIEHQNVIDIPFRFKEEPQKCKAYLSATAEWLKNQGYLNMAYMYLEDEPNNAAQYETVRKQGALIKSANTGIARLCTEQTKTSNKAWGNLYGAVDIWCPLWGLWDDSTAKIRLSMGEKMWSYTALCQGPDGTPWWQIDMDPVNFRSPIWISWHFNINGFLYWSSTWWNDYKTPQGVWEAPAFRNNYWGEGMLLYPGQPAGIKGFVPSIRLKLYREAVEDYEYMVLATNQGKGEEVKKIVDGIATSFQAWNHDQSAYEQARERLAELIQKVK
jgi:hypothetical protein